MDTFFSCGSPVTCRHGCVSSSQFLASEIGVNILKAGGNAADAAVAMAAALGVFEPYSTGLGGDGICLYFDAATRKVYAINATGKSPAKFTRELMNERGFDEKTGHPPNHGLTVTTPGAALGWISCLEKFGSGRFSLKDLLQPSIDLAREGFPVAGPVTSKQWRINSKFLLDERNTHGHDLMKVISPGSSAATVRAPYHGEIFKNPKLASLMEKFAKGGRNVFYNGWIADSIVESVQKFGGVMEKNDLKDLEATFEDPISIDYKGFTLWETSPNSQGIIALIALNILKNFDLSGYQPDSAEYWHILIEALKLAYADGVAYCADPSKVPVPISELLSVDYGKKRAGLISVNTVMSNPAKGQPADYGCETVHVSVVDESRNACSFINSVYNEFGSGIVPKDCGFCLQDRAKGFSLQPGHPNVIAPRKRPYHTIIPAMVTDSFTGDLVMSFGVTQGFMQPQGHVQVFLNCVQFGMNPQQALDFPRIRISHDSDIVRVQDDMPPSVISALKANGHNIKIADRSSARFEFGVGQAIATRQFWNHDCDDNGALYGASDRRHDGIAIGY